MLDRYQNKYRIGSTRLNGWDYSSAGYYFVTICVKDRKNCLGKIIDGVVELSGMGKIAARCWNEILLHYAYVESDQCIVMPNHVHGIIVIKNDNILDGGTIRRRDAINRVSTVPTPSVNNGKSGGITGQHNPMTGNSLSKIIRWYKGRTAFEIHQLDTGEAFQWQPRFFDHIIRDEQSLHNIRQYIIDNPSQWMQDSEYRGDL